MTDPGRPAVSLVVPVYNERESLTGLHAEIDAAARANNLVLEVVFVDDGSTDESWLVVKELAATDPRVRGIRFRRNFGKAAALQAGFTAARGARVVTLDADLQDDPAEVPNFLAHLDKGYDLVSGWKKVRHDPWHKVLASRAFNGLVSRVTGVKLHDHNCGMKAYTADVVRELRLYGEMHRFVPVLAAAKGFRVGELVIHHRPRKYGRSKYGVKRFVRGFLDLLTVQYLTTFGRRPMHRFGAWAIVLGLVAGLLAVVGLIRDVPVPGLVFLGAILLVLALLAYLNGLQAELIVSARTDEPYSVAERVGFAE
jgi:glycosyltransferase involved in cell wall biosynthesis